MRHGTTFSKFWAYGPAAAFVSAAVESIPEWRNPRCSRRRPPSLRSSLPSPSLASIDSPLTALGEEHERALEEAARKTVFEEDFGAFDMLEAVWRRSDGLEVEQTGEGRVLLVRRMQRPLSVRAKWLSPRGNR